MYDTPNVLIGIEYPPEIIKSITHMKTNCQIVFKRSLYLISEYFFLICFRRVIVVVVESAFANGNQVTGKYSIERKVGYEWNSTQPKLSAATVTRLPSAMP